MTEAARGYLVRDADSTRGKGAKVDQIYPYTLRGLTEALEEARFRSHSGAPQVLAILGTGNTRVIRRFENGREVPVAPLPTVAPRLPEQVAAATGRPRRFLADWAATAEARHAIGVDGPDRLYFSARLTR
jgi:hypothetical protein